MSTYGDSFEEETPSTSANTSQVSASNAASSAATAKSLHTASHSSEEAGAAATARKRPRRLAVTPEVVPPLVSSLPVPVAVLPTAVPIPIPTPVAALRSSSSSKSGGGDSDRSSSHDAKDSHSHIDVAEGETTFRPADARVREALASGEWTVHKDAASGRTYYYNPRTQKTTWDLIAELDVDAPQGGSLPYGGVARGSSSASTLSGAAGERQRAANAAADRSEFQQLTRYVAFGSGSAPASAARSSVANTAPAPTAGAAAAPVTAHEVLEGGTTSGPEGEETRTPPPSQAGAGAKQDSQLSPEPVAVAAKSAAGSDTTPQKGSDKTSAAEDPSSVFSTLSQHLKADPPLGPVTTVPAATAPGNEKPSAAVALTNGESGGTTQKLSAEATTAVPAPVAPAVAPFTLILPNLPPPSFSAPPKSPFAAADASSSPMALMASALPPPLPPAGAAASTPTSTAMHVDPKLAELRETSEAVERLVRAFAMLREGGKPNQPPFSAASTMSERLGDTTMHKVGAVSTVRPVVEARLRRGPPLGPAPTVLSEDEKAAVVANDALVEEVLMGCVLEMLQDDLGKAAYRQRAAERVKKAPAHLTVSAESFRSGAIGGEDTHRCGGNSPGATSAAAKATRRGEIGRGTFSVFDSELRAFDADGVDAQDSAEALFDSVQTNLRKYVLSHVVDPTQPQPQQSPAASPGGGAAPTPVTPHFAWILLMDLLAVCMDIIECGFTESSSRGAASIPSAPVMVRYEGERHCELLARNAIHCLPFEVLETTMRGGSSDAAGNTNGNTNPSDGPRRRPLFRMEFWVTRAAMFTIVDAVGRTIREHLAHMAHTAPYAIFATDVNPYVNARVLAPSAVPMFRLVTDGHGRGREGAGSSELLSGGHRAKTNGVSSSTFPLKTSNADGKAGDDTYFGVPPTSLRAVACDLSRIATGLLEQTQRMASSTTPARNGGRLVPDSESYEDLATSVSEAVGELLGDTAIRAAVSRRAMEKFETQQTARRAYPSKTRLARERTIIEKAEKEAEELVRRITQEMLVREAGV